MCSLSRLKDYIGILFYRHGLFCASHPISCLFLVFWVLVICCYPLRNLSSFSSSLEQYKQPIDEWFDGLEANSHISEHLSYDRSPSRPGWYNRVPIAYIQRIVVKSVIHIPRSKKNGAVDSQLYLVDLFRTPLAQLFELNEFVKSFRHNNSTTKQPNSLVSDLCVHVGELSNQIAKRFNKHYLPEFNCLYLSPANFWLNDLETFVKEEDLMSRISELDASTAEEIKKSFDDMQPNFFTSLWNMIFASDVKEAQSRSKTSIKDLLFGVAWPSVLRPLDNDPVLMQKLNSSSSWKKRKHDTKHSIVVTYGITIALRKYDKEFLADLKQRLEEKFATENDEQYTMPLNSPTTGQEKPPTIYNLQYTRQSLVYYIPYIVLYFLLFLYIYISVRKIEFVKSKWGLAFAAVSQVIASLLMSVGICFYFGLTPTLNGGEIFPYLIIFIGFENIVVLTKSVVSTPFDLDVRYRIAYGLKKESWVITKILTFELIIIFFGICTMVPAIQEFCVFAYVGLLIDFFMQMIFFVTVLSIDIRRMELSDLNNRKLGKIKSRSKEENEPNSAAQHIEDSNVNSAASNGNLIFRGHNNHPSFVAQSIDRNSSPTSDDKNMSSMISNGSTVNKASSQLHHHHHNRKPVNSSSFQSYSYYKTMHKSYSTFFMNKSVQFFYFWARTRLVQRAMIALSAIWIILIFYKSLLIVELMQHDVNVRKEHMEALLPRGGPGFGLLFGKENILHLSASSTTNTPQSPTLAASGFDPNTPPPSVASSPDTISHQTLKLISSPFSSSTVDYLRRHFENFMIMAKLSSGGGLSHISSSASPFASVRAESHKAPDDEDAQTSWKTLSYYHWLTMFSYYNVSLYNRYVAILPQIDLYRLIRQQDLSKHRNINEIKKYGTVLAMDENDKMIVNTSSSSGDSDGDTLTIVNDMVSDDGAAAATQAASTYQTALYELVGIVVLGIPTIILVVYLSFLFYKCLCSKKYEQWRRTWSTVNIKRQYDLIHTKNKRKDASGGSRMRRHRSRRRNQDQFDPDSTSEYYSSDYENDANTSDSSAMEENDYDDDEVSKAKSARSRFHVGNEDKNSKDNCNAIDSSSDEEKQRTGGSQQRASKVRTVDEDDNENDDDEILNKIINGQKDNIDLEPCRILNATTGQRHMYQIDQIACGQYVCVTNDLSNQVNIWSLQVTGSTQLIKVIRNDVPNASIWSLCVSHDDRLLIIGYSNGLLRSIDLKSNQLSTHYADLIHPPEQLSGITSLICLKPSPTNPGVYLLLCLRVNGAADLVRLVVTKRPPQNNSSSLSFSLNFSLCASLKLHDHPITNQFYSPQSDYLLTTSQDCVLKLVKINRTIAENEYSPSSSSMSVIYEIGENVSLPPMTSMQIYENNRGNQSELCGVTGSQDGVIYVWNFLNGGECVFQLTNVKSSRLNQDRSIVRLEIVDDLVISLNGDHQMCIWNRVSGYLVKEVKFIPPALLYEMRTKENEANRLFSSDDSSLADRHSSTNLNIVSTLYMLSSSLIKTLISRRSILAGRGGSLTSSILSAMSEMYHLVPTMCLYSKNTLVTGGCACIFFWNIKSGELIKKININKHDDEHVIAVKSKKAKARDESIEHYSESSYVKEIRVIRQQQQQSSGVVVGESTDTSSPPVRTSGSKLLFVADYSDAIYLLKIPSYIL